MTFHAKRHSARQSAARSLSRERSTDVSGSGPRLTPLAKHFGTSMAPWGVTYCCHPMPQPSDLQDFYEG